MESWKNRSPVRDELGTAKAALGRVGRAGVCEHDEGVACRRVDLVASYREKGKNLRLRKAEELPQASTNNIVHIFIVHSTRILRGVWRTLAVVSCFAFSSRVLCPKTRVRPPSSLNPYAVSHLSGIVDRPQACYRQLPQSLWCIMCMCAQRVVKAASN